MELSDFTQSVMRKWPVIVAGLILGLIAGIAYGSSLPKEYAAQSSVLLSPVGASADQLSEVSTYISNNAPTYAGLATKPIVLDPVVQELGLPLSAEELSEHVRAERQVGTAIIDIRVTHRDPATAADIANAVASSLITAVGQVEAAPPTTDPGTPAATPAVRLVVVEEGQAPSQPEGGTVVLFGTIGAVLGLAVGVIAILIWNRVRALAPRRTLARQAQPAEL